jgi:hypothetical protein
MITARDVEAEYVDILSSMSPQQLWAIGIHSAACALVAAERGSTLAGTPDEIRTARELLFDREAERRNFEMSRAAPTVIRSVERVN